jgi:hypothetical protein
MPYAIAIGLVYAVSHLLVLIVPAIGKVLRIQSTSSQTLAAAKVHS